MGGNCAVICDGKVSDRRWGECDWGPEWILAALPEFRALAEKYELVGETGEVKFVRGGSWPATIQKV
jgi:hypothetical protein